MSESRAPSPDELPLDDYDQLPIGSLEGRIRSLDAEQLQVLLAYERAHADRPAVLQLLEQRLGQLEEGAEPSDGSPGAAHPEVQAPPPPEPPAKPQTEGPPINPPSQGVPSNPAQPRK